ncbi:hypothetical protein OFEAOIEE_LOCUS5245 [Methylorubrum extorquens]
MTIDRQQCRLRAFRQYGPQLLHDIRTACYISGVIKDRVSEEYNVRQDCLI